MVFRGSRAPHSYIPLVSGASGGGGRGALRIGLVVAIVILLAALAFFLLFR